ncbi:MAG: 16S rRNA (uracil(1498)-N(3))-methyltransferase [Acidobacteria bacterium]|nr:16S rRNA (uracil(1498)-N(3))-methyltransferase [Acidobacteriota bacterium]
MRNFYAHPSRIRGESIHLDLGEVHHARNVLRLAPGDKVQVTDGIGTLYQGGWDPHGGCVHIESTERRPPLRCEVTLAVALLKRDHWDWFLQKAVEIGASQIVPLLAHHSVVTFEEHDFETRKSRWEQITISALKQSGQAFLPSIKVPISMVDFCEKVSRGSRWILSEQGGLPLKAILTADLTCVTLLVGAEGGWSDVELHIAQREQFQPVSLGPHILRAETAPLYALSAIRFMTEWAAG